MTHRYQHEWKDNKKNPEKALEIAVRNVGGTVLASATTTSSVFVVIALSSMKTMRNFSLITRAVIFYALIAALLVLGPLLGINAKRKKKKISTRIKNRRSKYIFIINYDFPSIFL